MVLTPAPRRNHSTVVSASSANTIRKVATASSVGLISSLMPGPHLARQGALLQAAHEEDDDEFVERGSEGEQRA